MTDPAIAVCQPLLPGLRELEPYLSRLSSSRWYSNYGELYWDFRNGLAGLLDTDPDCLTLVSNATVGLALTLAARCESRSGLCMLPAWTFPASAAAATWAGLQPWFVDIDAQQWALTPDLARDALRAAPGEVAAVMPVAPFGSPLPMADWQAFEAETGVPVVVDAAAAIDTLQVGGVPAVLSLHATKALGIGEGGLVACSDKRLVQRVHQFANFGLTADRVSQIPGLNGKISEYTAAVGLAALASWPGQRERLREIARRYVSSLRGQVRFPPGFGDYASGTCVVWRDGVPADAFVSALTGKGIGTLRWWVRACPDHPAYQNAPTHGAETARRAARETIGLPMSPTLGDGDLDRVIEAVQDVLRVNSQDRALPGG